MIEIDDVNRSLGRDAWSPDCIRTQAVESSRSGRHLPSLPTKLNTWLRRVFIEVLR